MVWWRGCIVLTWRHSFRSRFLLQVSGEIHAQGAPGRECKAMGKHATSRRGLRSGPANCGLLIWREVMCPCGTGRCSIRGSTSSRGSRACDPSDQRRREGGRAESFPGEYVPADSMELPWRGAPLSA